MKRTSPGSSDRVALAVDATSQVAVARPFESAQQKPLSIDEVRARPVTLGVVAILGMGLAGMIGYVWVDIRGLERDFAQFRVDQARLDGSVSTQLAKLDEKLSTIKELLPQPIARKSTTTVEP